MFFLHFGECSLLRSHGRSSEVECNPKMNISFFNDLQGLFLFLCILVDVRRSDPLANNQKLNIIQKQTFSDDLGAFFVFIYLFIFWHFGQCSSLRSLSRSSEVEHNG